jgi:hypothetical protein
MQLVMFKGRHNSVRGWKIGKEGDMSLLHSATYRDEHLVETSSRRPPRRPDTYGRESSYAGMTGLLIYFTPVKLMRGI